MITTPERTTAPAKLFATLQAHAALHGITVLQSTDDHDRPLYVASRWAWCKHFDTLAALHAWLEQVTGKRV